MNTTHKKRLLNVARALRESPDPKGFTMLEFGRVNGCVSPSCAFGHYCARGDLQRTFVLKKKKNCHGRVDVWPYDTDGGIAGWDDDSVRDHFGISYEEAEDLFDVFGCDDARTPEAAARYIEQFVERKTKEAS